MKMQFGDKGFCVDDDKTFNIVQNEKMCTILSSGIYTNKILAPIRQLSTNAYDAHIQNKCPQRKFDVHLPSVDEPEFWIRDYGKGLTGKQIEQLYVTYGYSSKSESNDYIGCLGLGSKSPFAYSDSFKITSISEGKCYKYICYLDHKVPKINKFDEYATDEESGLKVSFQVKGYHDIQTFIHETYNFYRWINNKPNFINKELFFPELTIRNNAVFLSQFHYCELGILMGNIFYDLKLRDFINYAKSKGLCYDYIKMLEYRNIVLQSNIGDFDITVSRQSIQLTQKNVQKLEQLCKDFYVAEFEQSLQQIKSQPNKLLRYRKYEELTKERPYLTGLKKYVENSLSYNDENIKEDDYILFKGYFVYSYTYKTKYETYINRDGEYNFSNLCENDFYVIFDEKVKGSNNYKQFVKKNNKKCVVITNNLKFFDWCKSIGMIQKNKEQFDKYKVKRTRDDVFYRTLFTWKGLKFQKASIEELDKHQTIYYVPIKKNEIIDTKQLHVTGWLSIMHDYLNKETIFALRQKEYQKYKSEQNFINVVDLFEQTINKISLERKDQLYKISVGESIKPSLQRNFKKGIVFDKCLMQGEVLQQYKLLQDYIKIDKSKITESLNELDKLYFQYLRLFSQQKMNDYQKFYHYIYEKFRLIYDKLYYYDLTDQQLDEISHYIKFKELYIKQKVKDVI